MYMFNILRYQKAKYKYTIYKQLNKPNNLILRVGESV